MLENFELWQLAVLVFGALLVPNEGEVEILSTVINKSASADLTLHLFSNNVTPGHTDTLASYTEVSGGGYAAKTLTGASWTVTPGSPTVATYPEQSFTFTSVPGVATVYGYFVKKGTAVLWAERLPSAPFTVASAGDEVRVTPRYTQKNEGEA